MTEHQHTWREEYISPLTGKALRCIGCGVSMQVDYANNLENVASAALAMDGEISGYGPHMDGTFDAYKVIANVDGRAIVRRFREAVYAYRKALDAHAAAGASDQAGETNR